MDWHNFYVEFRIFVMSADKFNSSRKLLLALADPLIKPFLGTGKLVHSSEFADLVDFATQHAVEQRDTGYFVKLLALLKGSQYEAPFRDFLVNQIGISVERVGDAEHLRIPKSKVLVFVAFSSRMAIESLTTKPTAVPKKKPKPKPKKIDLMDSRLMLSGSFGSGKRR